MKDLVIFMNIINMVNCIVLGVFLFSGEESLWMLTWIVASMLFLMLTMKLDNWKKNDVNVATGEGEQE